MARRRHGRATEWQSADTGVVWGAARGAHGAVLLPDAGVNKRRIEDVYLYLWGCGCVLE